jgi:hypothetical protein
MHGTAEEARGAQNRIEQYPLIFGFEKQARVAKNRYAQGTPSYDVSCREAFPNFINHLPALT